MRSLVLAVCLFWATFVGASDRVYLASYPRSGNHWVRYLIEEATGVMTFCVHQDGNIVEAEPLNRFHDCFYPPYGYGATGGYLGQCRPPEEGEPVVVKTHYPYWNREFDRKPYKVAICLIRNPHHSLRSLRQVALDLDNPRPVVTRGQIDGWKKWVDYWERQPRKVIIRYEDLVENPHENLRLILETAGFKFSEEDIDRAIQQNPPRPSRLEGRETVPPHLQAYYQRRLGPILKRYGYLDE